MIERPTRVVGGPPPGPFEAMTDEQEEEFVRVLEGELGTLLDGDSATADTTSRRAPMLMFPAMHASDPIRQRHPTHGSQLIR